MISFAHSIGWTAVFAQHADTVANALACRKESGWTLRAGMPASSSMMGFAVRRSANEYARMFWARMVWNVLTGWQLNGCATNLFWGGFYVRFEWNLHLQHGLQSPRGPFSPPTERSPQLRLEAPKTRETQQAKSTHVNVALVERHGCKRAAARQHNIHTQTRKPQVSHVFELEKGTAASQFTRSQDARPNRTPAASRSRTTHQRQQHHAARWRPHP